MIDIVRVYESDFENIYPLLIKFNNKRLTKAHWERLFKSFWNRNEDYFGLALKDSDRFVGFHGLIFAQRYKNGINFTTANMSSWIVDENYRKYSMAMLLEIFKLGDYVFTNLTPNPIVSSLLPKLEFKVLAKNYYIIPAINLQNSKEKIVTGDLVQSMLSFEHANIYKDHIALNCINAVIIGSNDYCYILASKVIRKKMPFIAVHYISNEQIFAKAAPKLASKLCLKYNSIGLLIPDNLIKIKARGILSEVKSPNSMFFKSEIIDKHTLDLLYSEFVLLNI